MNIAIDIDDTLAKFQKGFLTYFNQIVGTQLKENDIVSYDFYTKSVPDLSKEEVLKIFLDFYNTDTFTNLEPLKNSREIVAQLSKEHTLYVVTSRPDYISIPSILWLEQHYPSLFNDFFFTNQFAAKKGATVKTKTEVCKELGATILIEDSFNHAKEAVENDLRAILINKPWNISLKDENIERVNGWEDIKELLLN